MNLGDVGAPRPGAGRHRAANHFHETPRVFFMHVHGMGSAEELARRVKPAVGLIDRAVASAPAPPPPPAAPAAPIIDGAALTKIIGHPGEQNGPVYKITIGRGDLDVREHGAAINARMGLNTWAAVRRNRCRRHGRRRRRDARRRGDAEVQALRANGLEVVAIHHHMIGVEPAVIFLHYYGTGPAAKLAAGGATVDLLATPPARN